MSKAVALAAALPALHDIPLRDITGAETTLAPYRNRVWLVVNVASRCGFTPQYEGLEALYRKYASQGLVVLGFPCNQFGGQEPEEEAQILEFCQSRYDVTFPMFTKIAVNGPDAHPLFTYLKDRAEGASTAKRIKWNFTKFLVDRTGERIRRYPSQTTPDELVTNIEAWLLK